MKTEFKIAVYSFYFGKWPDWIELHIESLKRNHSIDFHIFTDCDISFICPENVTIHHYDFKEYIRYISLKIGFKLEIVNPIKICDLRPMMGYIHQDVFKNYNYYGWCDLDLIFADIWKFYTPSILSSYEVFSSHRIRISGHFSLFKNNKRNRNKYKAIYDWKNKLTYSEFVGLDEHGITNAYTMTIFDKLNEKYHTHINNWFTKKLKVFKMRKLYLKEQYTTPFTTIPWIDGTLNSEQPDTWYYKDGLITNLRDGDREFMYIHFMNFKSSRWRHDGTKAPWEGKESVCFAKPEDMIVGIKIDNYGITPL